jgi:CheY-like chemotaxis protein
VTKTILLIDDSRTTRLLVKAYLVGENFEYIEASSGKEALEAIEKKPDLVICDVFMPGMDGIGFVRRLRSDPRRDVRRTPVILSSSRKESDIPTRALEVGADAFLPKPLAGHELLVAVRQLLEGSAARHAEKA